LYVKARDHMEPMDTSYAKVNFTYSLNM